MADAVLSLLSRHALFRSLDEASIRRIATLSSRRRADSGEILFWEGDAGDALYGVLSGRVRIGRSTSGGKEVFLSFVEPGDIFGEVALLDGGRRSATATAIEPSDLIRIARADFVALLAREPGLAVHLLAIVSAHMRNNLDLFEESVFLNIPARLARRLLGLVASEGGDKMIADGTELRISQADLARFVGVSRVIVNRHLRTWSRAGWIELNRNRIKLCHAEALRRVIQSDLDA